MQFTDLGLSAEILRAISEQGYDTPTPIQRESIPHVLAGRDLEALAQTGTGKTAAFVLPILQRLGQQAASPLNRAVHVAPRCLILVPTRELAAQVFDSVKAYGKHTRLRALAVFGGVGMNPQVQALARGIDILVATPGRLLDHMNQRTVDLRAVEVLVLDEADRMLDMGFIRDIRKILERLPSQRQNLMFSATFSPEIRDLARGLLHDPALVEVARRNTAAETVTQKIIQVDREKKKDALLHLFSEHGWHQVLVFTRTKHGADALSRKLDRAGIRSAALHGDKTQGARTRALADFKAGKLHALVATDIAARGIDIDQLPRVVNFELPNVPEDYVHRIGRTGRAGAEGEAFSLVCPDERVQLRDIERLMKRDLERLTLPGFEPAPGAFAGPASAPRPRGNGGGGRPAGGGDARRRPASASNQGKPREGGGRSSGEASREGSRQGGREGGGEGRREARSGGPTTNQGASHRQGSRHR